MKPWINPRGAWTLFVKETRRFMSVVVQTVLAPVITALLYLLVFGHVMDRSQQVYPGVGYTAFLIPGLIMMSVIQNAFANTSSSIIQSKMMGNLIFILMAPLSTLDLFLSFTAAAVLRGVMVGGGLYAIGWLVTPLPLAHPVFTLAMLVLAGTALGILGMISALVADKIEHLSAFQNFFIMPLSFLSGVFYSIHSLPPVWRSLSHYNPFFYMIDGFRYGFFGVGDTSPVLCLLFVTGFVVLASSICMGLLQSGYKIRP
jgi:ABC-2 type transport system permease protein